MLIEEQAAHEQHWLGLKAGQIRAATKIRRPKGQDWHGLTELCHARHHLKSPSFCVGAGRDSVRQLQQSSPRPQAFTRNGRFLWLERFRLVQCVRAAARNCPLGKRRDRSRFYNKRRRGNKFAQCQFKIGFGIANICFEVFQAVLPDCRTILQTLNFNILFDLQMGSESEHHFGRSADLVRWETPPALPGRQ